MNACTKIVSVLSEQSDRGHASRSRGHGTTDHVSPSHARRGQSGTLSSRIAPPRPQQSAHDGNHLFRHSPSSRRSRSGSTRQKVCCSPSTSTTGICSQYALCSASSRGDVLLLPARSRLGAHRLDHRTRVVTEMAPRFARRASPSGRPPSSSYAAAKDSCGPFSARARTGAVSCPQPPLRDRINTPAAESSRPVVPARQEPPNRLAMLTIWPHWDGSRPVGAPRHARSVLAGEAAAEAALKSTLEPQDAPPRGTDAPGTGQTVRRTRLPRLRRRTRRRLLRPRQHRDAGRRDLPLRPRPLQAQVLPAPRTRPVRLAAGLVQARRASRTPSTCRTPATAPCPSSRATASPS